MTVAFNEVESFSRELKADREKVERRIVRIAYEFESPPAMPYTTVYLLATARIDGEIVRLKYRAGERWGKGFEETDAPTNTRLQCARFDIEKVCAECGLEVRNGVFE